MPTNVTDMLDLMKKSVITKIIFIGFLCLLLLIPFAMIDSLIYERQARKTEAIEDIYSKWALSQTLVGPVLEIPYKVFIKSKTMSSDGEEKRVVVSEKKYAAYFLPDQLTVNGTVIPEERYRGIYKTIVYTGDVEINGQFTFPDFGKLTVSDVEVLWDEAVFCFGLSDMKGINKEILLEWNKIKLEPKSGVRNKALFKGGISTRAPLDVEKKGIQSFVMRLNLRGSRSIGFLPFGRKTRVRLSSQWKSPSFNGAFLPKTREIGEKGFTAYWEIFDFNRSFPQQWKESDGKNWNVYDSKFGLELFIPVDEYRKTTRSIKYVLLFIFLTFLAYFLIVELFNNRRIHPLQYLMVGSALSIFYLLLLSLSEHIAFDLSYTAASAAIVALTTVYTRWVSRKWSLGVILGVIIASLYGFLYVILSLEDYSLLVGSLGLFAVLAAVMMGTRKIDWYSFKLEKK